MAGSAGAWRDSFVIARAAIRRSLEVLSEAIILADGHGESSIGFLSFAWSDEFAVDVIESVIS